MLPLRFFRSRAFAATSGVSLAMSFGIFGSIFLLAQYFQTVKGYGPLEAGLRTLPWTGMPMLVAPIAGALSDRIGSRPLMAAGLALQAVAIVWLAAVTTTDVAYSALVPAFVLGGTGMALVFSPVANAILGAVPARTRRARPPAPTTRSASSAASSASRSSPRCSARRAATSPARRSSTGLRRRWGRRGGARRGRRGGALVPAAGGGRRPAAGRAAPAGAGPRLRTANCSGEGVRPPSRRRIRAGVRSWG